MSMAKSGSIALVAALLSMLVGAVWFAVCAWTSVDGPPMPQIGYVAMSLGVFFSLLIGFGLMALIFYSARHGYDEPPQAEHNSE
jgi:formate hydrogenlyase subunit 3/multisubunit Na+/H+ antiporter MnhD subunit